MGRVEREICIELAYSPCAGRVERLTLTLPEGSTVAHALERSGWPLPANAPVGVWGRPCTLNELLRDRDRVEMYRPLKVDPKEARRQRHRLQLNASTR